MVITQPLPVGYMGRQFPTGQGKGNREAILQAKNGAPCGTPFGRNSGSIREHVSLIVEAYGTGC